MTLGLDSGRVTTQAKPSINVTPLIDVLLVMLIIFMIAAPLKPARFLTKVPSEPERDDRIQPNDKTLVVTIKSDRTLMLNKMTDMGSVNDPSKVVSTLFDLFENHRKPRAHLLPIVDSRPYIAKNSCDVGCKFFHSRR